MNGVTLPDIDPEALADEGAWPTDDLKALEEAVAAELGRRWRVESAAQRAQEVQDRAQAELDEIATGYHAAKHGLIGSPDNPVLYSRPTGAHDAWPLGAFVIHEDVVYQSLIPNNTTVPGEDGGRFWGPWQPSDEYGPTLEWSPDAYYRVGARRTRAGATYTCLHEHQGAIGWEPDNPAMHAVWKRED